ncbi:hypothetical protein IWZ00DRAFT_559205 [Phyllosticta capitalensis]
MPAITRAQAKTASKSRLEPYTVPARGSHPQQTPRPARSSPPAVREPIADQRPRARPKFRWTWTADRKLLVNIIDVRLPLSEAACVQLADLFNGPTSEDIRARVELLHGQRELTLREDAEAAESTAPTEDAVESQQLAAEEVDPSDLHRSDASLHSSVEVEGGCSPTLQPMVAPASPSSSLSSLSSLSPSPSPPPSLTPSTPSPSPRPDSDQSESPASNGDCQSSPSSRRSTPTPADSSTSSSQSPRRSEPILLADGRPMKSILKTSRQGSGSSVRFDDGATERREFEVDQLGSYKVEQQPRREWVPVENADWEQPLLKRERDDDDDDDGDDQRPRKKHCTAGHVEHAGPTKHPRFFPNHKVAFPEPVKTIAALAASQEWQDSDREVPRSINRRSVVQYPRGRERRMAYASPTQFADYAPNTPRAGLYTPLDRNVGPALTAEEEEDLAKRLPGAKRYVATAEELALEEPFRDDAPNHAPESTSPLGVEELSASDDESDSASSHGEDLVDSKGNIPLPPPPTPEAVAEFRRYALEWLAQKREEERRAQAVHGEEHDEDDGWEPCDQFGN